MIFASVEGDGRYCLGLFLFLGAMMWLSHYSPPRRRIEEEAQEEEGEDDV